MKNTYKHTNQQFFKFEITLQDQEMSLCQGKNLIRKFFCAQNRGISSNLSSSIRRGWTLGSTFAFIFHQSCLQKKKNIIEWFPQKYFFVFQRLLSLADLKPGTFSSWSRWDDQCTSLPILYILWLTRYFGLVLGISPGLSYSVLVFGTGTWPGSKAQAWRKARIK